MLLPEVSGTGSMATPGARPNWSDQETVVDEEEEEESPCGSF